MTEPAPERDWGLLVEPDAPVVQPDVTPEVAAEEREAAPELVVVEGGDMPGC